VGCSRNPVQNCGWGQELGGEKEKGGGKREDLSFVVQSHWVSAAAASCTGASLFGSSPEITTGTSNNIISVHSIIYIEINIIIYIYF